MTVPKETIPIKSKSIIKPQRLTQGDWVGVISPAGPVPENDLQNGFRLLETYGFRVRVSPHAYDRTSYLAGQDEDRLDDLHAMFLDRDIKAVFCTRGGYGTHRILDRIQYDLIKKNPKVLMGFSDITALLMAVYTITGLVTFHGPMIRALGGGAQENWEGLLRLLTTKRPFTISFKGAPTLVRGKAEGVVLGGNLSLISNLVGTPYLPPLKGCILFLEERGEPLYRIDRMLTHLKLSGQLTGLAGLVFGDFFECGDSSEMEGLFREVAMGLNIPAAMGLPVGHGNENVAMPIGLQADLDTERGTLSLKEPGIE